MSWIHTTFLLGVIQTIPNNPWKDIWHAYDMNNIFQHLDIAIEKGVKMGFTTNFWRQKNLRISRRELFRKNREISCRVNLEIFIKKHINCNFWTKNPVFWLYLSHFFGFWQNKKNWNMDLYNFGHFFVKEILV